MEQGPTEDMPWGLQLILNVLRKHLQSYTSLLTNHLKSQEIPLAQIWFRPCLDCSYQVLRLALHKLHLNSVFSQPWEVSISTSLTFWFYNIHFIRQNSELLEGKCKVPSVPTQASQKLVSCRQLRTLWGQLPQLWQWATSTTPNCVSEPPRLLLHTSTVWVLRCHRTMVLISCSSMGSAVPSTCSSTARLSYRFIK